MKPLIVLSGVFLLSILGSKIFQGKVDYGFSGRLAMAAMLLFSALGHFLYTKGMAMMIPPFLPYKEELVYITGVFEIIMAVGLMVPGYQSRTGWILIVFLILVLPANIYAAVKHVNYQQATFDGSGPGYLWFRVPLQVLFITWTYLFSIFKQGT